MVTGASNSAQVISDSAVTALTPEVPLHKNSAFLSLWSLGALNSTGRWLETLVVAIFVFDQTASPFLVASMLVLRLLPMSLFGLFGGIIAQRAGTDRSRRVANAGNTTEAGLRLR